MRAIFWTETSDRDRPQQTRTRFQKLETGLLQHHAEREIIGFSKTGSTFRGRVPSSLLRSTANVGKGAT